MDQEIKDFIDRAILAERRLTAEKFRGAKAVIAEKFRSRDEAIKLLVAQATGRTTTLVALIGLALTVLIIVLGFYRK